MDETTEEDYGLETVPTEEIAEIEEIEDIDEIEAIDDHIEDVVQPEQGAPETVKVL